jgi:methylenetetrahydrofolate dehydrogenase (NADP+)/methenyltetrahydrofolate cyclohydrolase
MILDGKVVAASIKERLKDDIDEAVGAGMRRPRLVIISVGDDPASKVYVRNKLKVAEEVGIIATHFHMTEDVDSEYVKDIIYEMNLDGNIDGIMVQLPLPEHMNEREIIDAILPFKDVDGLTTVNIGCLRSGQDCLRPCTAQGVIDLLKYYDIKMEGKDVTIVGRSNIVGKPLADLFMAEGATVTQCHSHTRYLEVDTKKADILVSAIGKSKFLNDDYVGFGAVVIDVGINRDEDGKLCGDVDFEDVKWKVQHITPVPGGVGPMTVAELMVNVVKAWKDNR